MAHRGERSETVEAAAAGAQREGPSARSRPLHRVGSSWWAPWVLLALGAALWLAAVGAGHGQSWVGLVPLAALLCVLVGVPRLRARCAGGMRILSEAAAVRGRWVSFLDQGGAPGLIYRRGLRSRLPRIVAVEPGAGRGGAAGGLVVVAESFGWRDAAARWEAALPALVEALDLPAAGARVELSDGGARARLIFGAGGVGAEGGGLAPWRDHFPKAFPEDLERVVVARDEAGAPVDVALLYSHLFVYGATGSGKGSVLWSIIGALAPGIPRGLVELWGIDPKGGMEFVYGEGVFHRMGDGTPDELRLMVREFRDLVRERAQELKAERCRKFVPTSGRPLRVLLIDEYLSLIVLQPSPAAKREVEEMLLEILSKGRAIGFAVIGAAQLAQKEYLKALREMFPQQICLRTTSKTQTMMALEDALEHGALAHEIPDDGKHQGIGYYKRGSSVPVKIRFAQWTDADIEAMDRWVQSQPRVELPVVVGSEVSAGEIQDVVEAEPAAPRRAPGRSSSRAGGDSGAESTPPAPGVRLEPWDLVLGPLPSTTASAPAPVRTPSKRDVVWAYLEGLPAGAELPSVRALADACGVSVGLASQVRAAFIPPVQSPCSPGSPGRSFAPRGDPTEHVKSQSNDGEDLKVKSSLRPDVLAEPDSALDLGSLP